jgi:hypothetical protein
MLRYREKEADLRCQGSLFNENKLQYFSTLVKSNNWENENFTTKNERFKFQQLAISLVHFAVLKYHFTIRMNIDNAAQNVISSQANTL